MLVPWVDCFMSFWWVTFCVLFWRCQWLLAGAMTTKVRRHDKRIHPYQRVVTPDRAATATNPWPLDLLTFPPTDDPPISARWRAHWPTAPPLPQLCQPDQHFGNNPGCFCLTNQPDDSDHGKKTSGPRPSSPNLNFTKRAFLPNVQSRSENVL